MGCRPPDRGGGAGDGDVEVRVHLGGLQLQLLPLTLQQLRQLGLGLVHGLAHLRPQAHVQPGQLLQKARQGALLAQQQALDLLQLAFAAGGADLLLPLLQQLCQFLFHMAPP